ncbi:MFS general substrate transporter [Martensiomyces pterosporus]|nr:MFS general substrate transporter [Martensiomyces pterosporus]
MSTENENSSASQSMSDALRHEPHGKGGAGVESEEPPHQDATARRTLLLTSLGIYVLMSLIGIYSSMDAVIYVPVANKLNALSRAEWILNGYLITSTALQPIYGKCSDIIGRVPAMLAATLLFLVGSVLCATSNTMNMLIASRAIQGLGSAGLYTMVNVVIADVFGERDRARFMGYSSAVWALCSSGGSVLGGAIAQLSNWRIAFWVNVPIAVIAAAIILVLLRLPKPSGTRQEKLRRIDFVGSLISLLSIVLILLALSWGGREYPWKSARVICCIVFGCLAAGLFVVYESRYPVEPIVPMRLFKARNVAISFVGHVFFGAATYAPLMLIPQWSIVVRNSTPITSALYTLPFSLAELVAVTITGIWVTKAGRYRESIWLGACALLIGTALLILLDQNSGLGHIIGFLAVAGIGFGACIQTLILAAQVSVSGKDSAATTSVCIFMRSLGNILVVAVLSSVSQNKRNGEFTKIAAEYPQYSKDIWMIAENQSLIHKLDLPPQVFDLLVSAFMKSMRAAFVALTPFSALFLLLSLGTKHVPLQTSKKVTIE